MPISRKFLDWSRPALPTVADYLVERYAQDSQLDLGGVLAVIPGRRAGRRLLELLLERAENDHPDFTPPEVVTGSSLPERLYEPQHTFATKSVERLAWLKALQSVDRNALRAFVPNPPRDEDFSGWMSLANQLIGLHRDLLADQLDFGSVVSAGSGLTGFDKAEERRWTILDKVQEKYLEILDEQLVWDRQTARKVAVEQCEIETDFDIVLIGSVDMNKTMKSILDQVADRVTSLIHAPEQQQHLFDNYGCLVTEEWQDVEIGLVDPQVHIVERQSNQARQVIECLAAYGGKYSADEITIGITDESLVPTIRRHCAASDVSARWVVEKTIRETLPFRLLKAIASFLDSNGSRSSEAAWWQASRFATLIRHPDLETWLHARPCFGEELKPRWLAQLDDYMADHLQPMLGFWLGNSNRCDSLKAAFDSIMELLSPIEDRTDSRAAIPRRLTGWSDPIRDVLMNVYGDQQLDFDHPHERIVIHAMESLFDALKEQSKIPEVLEPTVTSSEAIQMLLEAVASDPIPPLPDPDAVELLGWLELSLDDAPALVVTNFNEGFVPDSVTSDAFLPNRLRKRLGLSDNDNRYARDAYALTAMLNSREDVQIIVGKRDHRGDPLKPSRLLFATDPESIPQRVLSFLEPDHAPSQAAVEAVAGTQQVIRPVVVEVRPAKSPPAAPIMARKTRRRKSKKNAPDPRQMSLWGNDDDDDDDDTNETASSEVADVVDANDDMPTEVIAEIHPAIAEQPVAPVLKDPKVREVQQPAQPMRVRIFDPSHEQPPSPFFVPPPAPIEPITSISVTSFRTYLESPYRFYLRHVKHLQPADDRLRELDPMRFGNLIHEVLEAFGHSSERSSTSIKDIDATLMATLDERVENRLGRYRTAAVNVQIEQIRLRLKRFAVWQAKWVKDGWRIFYVEKEKDQITATLEIETGRTMGIHGRIDRIDQNVNTGEFAILDYKTGNDVKNPIKTHLQNDNWIDLQLPLYTILAKELEVTGRPKLGYIAVPASLDKVGDMLANWQPIDIEYAISVARDVADRIQKQEFGDLNNDKIKADYDDFSRICQMTVRSDV